MHDYKHLLYRFAFQPFPVPAKRFVLPPPIAHIFCFPDSRQRLYSHCYFPFLPDNIPVIGLWFLLSTDINISTPGVIPGPTHKLWILLAFAQFQCMPYSRFTQIIKGSPYKITNDIRMFSTRFQFTAASCATVSLPYMIRKGSF